MCIFMCMYVETGNGRILLSFTVKSPIFDNKLRTHSLIFSSSSNICGGFSINLMSLMNSMKAMNSMKSMKPLRSPRSKRIHAILIDLSGTLHIEDIPIEGAVDALARLQKREDVRLKFVTNTTKVRFST